jgi:hypothetical protein
MNTLPGKSYPLCDPSTDLAEHRFVGYNDALTGDGGKAKGVTPENGIKVGEQRALYNKGIFLVEAGATVAVGAKIKSNANGQAITHNTGEVNGYAVSAGSAGELILVDLI